MMEIPLSRGKSTMVDDADYEWLSQWPWYYDNTGYAARNGREGEKSKVFMHRAILGESSSKVDHRDRNKLNNRRGNLRPATGSQNSQNSTLRRSSTSGYKGVSFNKIACLWEAYVSCKGKRKFLGLFQSADEAAKMYDSAALVLYGEYAVFNLPELLDKELYLRGRPLLIKKNTSGFRGVSWCSQTNRWKAQITRGDRNVNLGRFQLVEDAAKAYDEAAVDCFGDRAMLNFRGA